MRRERRSISAGPHSCTWDERVSVRGALSGGSRVAWWRGSALVQWCCGAVVKRCGGVAACCSCVPE
eukprot:1313024-Alexandrium_andersonii.AAC.1